MGLREVSAVLWRERHLLELLLFKLDEEQLVLAAGRTRWLARAAREVEMVLEELRPTELERAVEVGRVAEVLGLPEGASLRQLADAAPPPWQGMLAEHREAFLTLAEDLRTNPSGLTSTDLGQLDAGYLRMQNALASVGSRCHQIELMRERNRAALAATARTVQPSLLDFLR